MAAAARDRGLLWRVEHQGRSAWLYGTIHVARHSWAFAGPTVLQALRDADSLALELNLLDAAQLAALQAGMRAHPQAPPLPADLAQRLAAQARAACVAPGLAPLRPDAQVMALLSLVGRRQGLDPAYGIDGALAATAQRQGKPIWALETPEMQLRELVSDDPAKVRSSVRSGLQQLESGSAPPQIARLAQAWAEGDVQQLERYPQWCNCLHTAAERADYARLVEGRNPAMARQVAAQLRAGHAPFVAVGALHMVGPQGLPALLAAEGFAVQRVHWPNPAPAARQAASESKAPAAQ